MPTALDALIAAHSASGDARVVDHAEVAEAMDVAGELEALHPHCFGWAMACCGRRRDDAEDVLHDVYVKVLGGSLRFDGRSAVKTWLFGIIRQTARAQRRRDRL